ncbi:MAG: FkbM family methyltransferase [Gammaproteobacteria bacterium]|jgi:FkbM family methyltransferase
MSKLNPGIFIAAFRTYMRNIKGRKFEPEIKFLKNIIREGNNCLHIGASDARHSYIMSELIGNNGHVYAFEPSSYSYGHLALMVKLHRLKNVKTYRLAVSDKAGSVCLVTPEKSTGHAGRSFAFITGLGITNINRTDIESEKVTKEEVASVSIDDFVSENNIETIDFIRCDTEGSEMLILKGANKTLKKNKPSILLEIHSDALKEVFNSSAKEVSGFLFDLGYHMFREDDGKILQVNEVDESESWKDYFFIHSERVESLPKGPFSKLLA